MKNKKQIINSISRRINDEYIKHKKLDWAKIAAIKIYKEYFEDQKVYVKWSDGTKTFLKKEILNYLK